MEIIHYKSPIGPIQLHISNKGIRSLQFVKEMPQEALKPQQENLLFIEIQEQLDAYFNKQIKSFQLPLDIEGTEFQKRVWEKLMAIPYGITISYSKLAYMLGDPNVIRAAASANGRNPILLIVPCHRVIGQQGALTGYAGGIDRKQWLLIHEGAIAATPQSLF